MTKNMSNSIISYLYELSQEKTKFFISSVSIYELINGANKDKQEKVYETIKSYERFEISDEVLVLAGMLEKTYRTENYLNRLFFSDMDKIISATCILENTKLITGDRNGFPAPFFTEVSWQRIDYHKNKPVSQWICILEPNLDRISDGNKHRK